MKKEEKTDLTKKRIIKAATQEFGQKGYEATTLNSICNNHSIAKGLMYHNFKGKDEIYLTCVNECFQSLTSYLKSNTDEYNLNPEEQLKKYLITRLSFFNQYPLYQRIFYDAITFLPIHLEKDIKKIKAEFDNFNIYMLTKSLNNLKLRDDITIDEVIETFKLYQDFINIRYQINGANNIDFKLHEKQCYKALNILLYGITKRKEEEE